MARKGNITVDIKTENPLQTIIKAGKIPVVRLATTGFQNFNQKKYFNHYKEAEFIDKSCNETEKGCFVSLAGVQGNYVCGSHYGESIHIGYLEPDDAIFSTRVFRGKKGYYCKQTAKERFDSITEVYDVFQKGVKEDNWDPDDFDLYSEAIVDSCKIRKVMVIQPEEYHLLLPYCNDGLFRIFDTKTIFYHMAWRRTISKEFMSHMGWIENQENIICYKDIKVYNLMENKYYSKVVLEELINFYLHNSFLRTKDFYDGLQDTILNYREKFYEKYGKMVYDEDSILRMFDENSLNLYYEKDGWREEYRISASTDKDEVFLTIPKSSKYDRDRKFESLKFTEKNILSQKYRHMLYNLIDMKELFDECMGGHLKIESPKWMQILNAFRKTEQEIGKWGLVYSYDEENHEIVFNVDNFNFVYSMILFDGVVETRMEDENGNRFYNLDNLPKFFDRFWLDIILETLKIWESLFFFAKI